MTDKDKQNHISIYPSTDLLAWIDGLEGPSRNWKILAALEAYRKQQSVERSWESAVEARLTEAERLLKQIKEGSRI
jgi:hypothetical protein